MNSTTVGDSNLIALLRSRGQQLSTDPAFTFLADGEIATGSLTFGTLLRRAQAIAASLQRRHAQGERALLLFPPGLEFISAFFGCILADVIAVPTYPPRRNRPDQRLQLIADDAQAVFALTTSNVLSDLDGWCAHAPQLRQLDWLATDAVKSTEADAWQQPLVNADSLAFLQYTSGSTSSPKGVMVSHGNLLHTLCDLDRGFQHTDDSVIVSWLPTFHDLGLIYGTLMPVYCGIPCYLIPPAVFLQRPSCWLEAISRYRATHSAAPNFAYELCAAKVTDADRQRLDLSSWKMTLNAAEPVREESLRRFAAALQPCGFDSRALTPGYGLAEASLKVTSDRADQQRVCFDVDGDELARHRVVAATPDTLNRQTLVGCGQSEVETRIVIVDPETGTACSADQVGEVWVAGSCVAQGYWNRPDQTEQTFQARLSDTEEGPFLRTGDLGFTREGQLYLTGRLKDLIIIRGLNHYPQDIELTVETSHRALRAGCGAAFSIEVDGSERLVVVQELERTANQRQLDLPSVGIAIRQAVAEAHDLQLHAIALLRTASIPKTSSGKIQRHACRIGFLDETLKVIWQWREADLAGGMQDGPECPAPAPITVSTSPTGDTESWLRTVLAPWLQVPASRIDIDAPFVRYGIDSLTAVRISGELASCLNRRLPPTLLYDHPTVRSLAFSLAGSTARAAPEDEDPEDRDLGRPDQSDEPIAIIGMGCRFPGAESPRAFWNLLREGTDAVTEVSPSRWDDGEFYDPTPGTSGKSISRWGGFLSQVDQFDADFFGISPGEAKAMDPQQRLVLEVAWEALEDAGLVKVAGTQTGVFVGISSFDYWRLNFDQPGGASAYAGTGNALSIAANRLSYYLDLRGPSLAIDTACSSSLVALHLACESLRQGQSATAIAGGVNLLLTPDLTIAFSQAQMLSPAGRCKTFDVDADGYVRGEGCGMVVLKRLSDARRDNDRILAIVRGSAVNQDGRSNGLTAPNGPSQQAVIREALVRAGVAATQVSYVEAHGTGTSLGDPIELNSLAGLLGQGRSSDQPCWVGSVKTNIGHLEAAAGIAGLIKVVLAMQHRQLPRHLHLNTLNPHIALQDTPLSIPTDLTAWPENGAPRIAGVSAFGFGGTNAHAIVEEAPPRKPSPDESGTPPKSESSHQVLPLSGRCDSSLQALAGRYHAWLEEHPDAELADVCFTAGAGRSHQERRAALVVASRHEASSLLAALSRGESAGGLVRGQGTTQAKLAWLFTGQGSQYVGMARPLYDSQPVFREVLDRCRQVLAEVREGSLLSVLFEQEAELHQTRWTQPALFAVELGLARLWQSWGVEPDVVLGHSVGQYAAACVAGVFSLEDGLKLLAERGRLMDQLCQEGGMAAVLASPEIVAEAIAREPRLSIAAHNGGNTVISGEAAALAAVIDKLSAQGIRCRRLQTSRAFHSGLIEPALEPWQQYARQLDFQPPRRTLICNVSGQALAADAVLDAAYWREHARRPVQFARSMQTLDQLGCRLLLEVGPQPVLTGMAATCWPGAEPPVLLSSLQREQAADQSLAAALAGLYVQGITADFAAVHRPWPRRKLALPTYPFQRQRHWIEDQGPNPRRGVPASETLQMLAQGHLDQLQQALREEGAFGEQDDAVARRLLQRLQTRHQREQAAAGIQDSLYQVQWRLTEEVALPEQPPEVGRWLLLSDRQGLGKALAAGLAQRGQTVHRVCAEELDLERADAFQELLQEFGGDSSRPLRGVVHLGSLDLPREVSAASLPAMQRLALTSTLHLVQALARAPWDAPLYLVTRGGQSVHQSDQVHPAQTPLWGLGKVISLELPELWGGLVDLPSDGDEHCGQRLLSALLAADGEDQVALRQAGRYAARLTRMPASSAFPALPVQAEASYLITGGLGVLGLKAARWLAEQGAGQVVLTSRSAATAAAQASLREIETDTACRVHVMRADVGDQREVQQLFEQIQRDLPPLKGILHAAGVESFQPLTTLTADELAAVLRPKVQGGWNVHQAAHTAQLDFFVGFSSIAAVWGSQGQGHYAAANAFLDGLAHYQRGQGVPGRSINFGPWSGGGMVDEQARQWLAKAGLRTLPPRQALAGCQWLVGSAQTQAVVADVDWPRFLEIYQARRRRPLLAELAAQAQTVTVDGQPTPLVQRLEQVSATQRRTLLEEHLRQRAGETLRLEPSQVDPEVGFFNLGMNSLMAVEFRRNLEQDLGRSLPATLAMDRPRIADLVDYLLGEVLALEAVADKRALPPEAAFSNEPIAVVGLSCRTPGAEDADAFWQLLERGDDAITEVPADRWDVETYYDPNPEAPGKIYTRRAGFISHIDQFDPRLFGISPREAQSMDPQQRLLLEVSWEALERAAIAPRSLLHSRSGVYVGVGVNEYGMLLADGGGTIDSYYATGNALNAVAGRLAFVLGLEGPALAIDTACSSSLVALHQAIQGLRGGDCDLALAGGVNVILRPESMIATCRAQMLAPDGRCKTFDATADGYARGEGCGVVVLKRLADAREAGDHILAVIRGSAVNQDGASSGLTVPNGPAQERVLTKALQQARIEPADVDYLEAHGTGTSLGDPIEVQAAAAALGAGRDPQRPLLIGSVKTNIGHLEAAAGIAGLIKVVLAMQHGVIPRHLHFDSPNPHIPWDQLPVQVTSQATPWPQTGKPPIAGVSAFGFSGTNAHLVLEGPPQTLPAPRTNDPQPKQHLLTVSAKSEKALEDLAGRYHAWLDEHPDAELADVCFTANTGRSHLPHRVAVIAESREEMAQRLTSVARGLPLDEATVESGGVASGETYEPLSQVAFLFTGQGSQYVGMAGELFATQPVFREAMQRCDEILRSQRQQSLLSVLYPEQSTDSPLDETQWTQPALFAVSYALSELWKSWGIVPSAVLGHSVGEFAAACVAGVLELPDALQLVSERGTLMQQLPPDGMMAAVTAGVDRVEPFLDGFQDDVSIAAENGPSRTVISGARHALEQVLAELERNGIAAMRLNTSHAFHSPLIEPALDGLAAAAADLQISPPRIPLVANLTGELADGTFGSPEYWRQQARNPVQFARGMRQLGQLGCRAFIEIGPSPVLLGMGRACLPASDDETLWLPSLRRGSGDWRQVLQSLSQLYVHGAAVDWSGFDQPFARRRLVLPSYPFDRQRYWIAPATTGNASRSSNPDVAVAAGHPLLGARRLSPLPRDEVEFSCQLSPQRPSYLGGHRIFGVTLLPLSAYLEMALAAGREVFGDRTFTIGSVGISQPVTLHDQHAIAVHVVLSPQPSGYRFQVFSAAADGGDTLPWQLHAEADLAPETDMTKPTAETDARSATQTTPSMPAETELTQTGTRPRFDEMDVEQFYAAGRRRGIDLQPSASALERLWRGESEAMARIRLPESLAAATDGYQFHPVLLDACLHTAAAALPESVDDAWLLAGVERMQVVAASHLARRVHARLRPTTHEPSYVADLRVAADDGTLVAMIEGLQLRKARRQLLVDRKSVSSRDDLYEVEWVRQDHDAAVGLAAPREIMGQLSAEQASLGDRAELTEFGHALGQVEEICAALAWQSLRQSAWPPRMGERFQFAEMAQRLGVVAQYEPLLVRLLDIFEEEGLFRRDGDAWEVVGLVNGRDARSELHKTAQHAPAIEVVAELLDRCAAGLPGVLRGEVDPTELLFPGGDLTSLTRLYQDSAPAAAMNELVARAVATAVAELPAEAKLRVLEIGAGTGATSSYVLPELPAERTEYVLTDVDGKLVDAARARFRGYGFLSCELLNIERDADAQGFAGRRFDLVLAANVLHATRDIRESMDNAAKLLAPGGLLLLLEGTRPLRCLDLTFGLTEAWWKFRDRTLRPTHPLISADQWLRLLADAGWQDAAAIPGDTDDTRRRMNQTMILARKPKLSVAQTVPPGRWLILADDTDRGRRLTELLQAGGQHCTLVSNRQLGDAATDYDRLLEPYLSGREQLHGVVHFATPTGPALTGTPGVDVKQACRASCRAALLIVQALVRAELPRQPRLWLVTSGAIDGLGLHVTDGTRNNGGDESSLALAQATVWGLGKVIAREHSEFQSVLIDLDPEADADGVPELVAELHTADRALEGQVAFRQGGRYVPRVVRSRSSVKPNPTVVHPDRTYLITGGLGAIGLRVARWLVDRGARHLLLLGRSEPTGAAQSALKQLQGEGIDVVYRRADVSQHQQLASAWEDVERRLPPLAGVFHLAGVFADRLVVEHSWELFEEVFAPKVSGAWNLHCLTRDRELDMFVLFSSASTLLGTTGVANYVAANQFLDGLAALRRGQGLAGLSINWGPWADLGMARSAAGKRIDEWSALGMRTLQPSQALDALDVVLDLETPQVAVMSMDWSRLSAHPAAQSYGRLLGSLLETTHRQPTPRQQIESAPANQRRAMLASHVCGLVGRVLGTAADETLSMKRGFFDMGMDSLRATELRNLLQTNFDCALSSTLTFKFPTIEALVDHLDESLFAVSGGPRGSGEGARSNAAEATDASRQEADADKAIVLQQIDDELAQLENMLKAGP